MIIPDIPVAGRCMSAGQTSLTRIIIRQFKAMGLMVSGANLTGTSRNHHIPAMSNAGSNTVSGLVGVGLSSIVCPVDISAGKVK